MMTDKFDPAIVEAEENLLIDIQFLLHEVITRKGLSLSQLADKAGVTKGRISQILSPDANPTAKTFARLFHALGEEIVVATKKKRAVATQPMRDSGSQWEWAFVDPAPINKLKNSAETDQLVAIVKEAAFATNDNYAPVMMMDETNPLKAA